MSKWVGGVVVSAIVVGLFLTVGCGSEERERLRALAKSFDGSAASFELLKSTIDSQLTAMNYDSGERIVVIEGRDRFFFELVDILNKKIAEHCDPEVLARVIPNTPPPRSQVLSDTTIGGMARRREIESTLVGPIRSLGIEAVEKWSSWIDSFGDEISTTEYRVTIDRDQLDLAVTVIAHELRASAAPVTATRPAN